MRHPHRGFSRPLIHPFTRPFTRRSALGLAALALAGSAWATDPGRITIIVPYPPGGLADIIARLSGKVLAQNMGVPVIVENKPGANGMLGLQAVAHAAPDSGTIGLVPASVLTVNPSIYKDSKVDTVEDLRHLTLAATFPNVLVVNNNLPVKTLDELLAAAKKQPLSFGTMGTGSSAHLNGEMLQTSGKVTLTHVPYKGSAAAMQDLMGGNIQMAFENLPVALPLIQAGKIRAIAVTSEKPSPVAPEIPALHDVLPGFRDNIWFGFIAPARMPADYAARLQQELGRAMQAEEVAGTLRQRGAVVQTSSAEAFRKTVADERSQWARLIKERNIQVN